jgi:hypothetical protein
LQQTAYLLDNLIGAMSLGGTRRARWRSIWSTRMTVLRLIMPASDQAGESDQTEGRLEKAQRGQSRQFSDQAEDFRLAREGRGPRDAPFTKKDVSNAKCS